MSNDRLELLKTYIKSGVSPLLVSDVPLSIFENSVIIKANIDKSELNGHYESINFTPPTWYKELIEKSKEKTSVLIIENINDISIEEQTKFIEILKYKKVSTFDLPKKSIIIVTCTELSKNKINEEVYSLLAQI